MTIEQSNGICKISGDLTFERAREVFNSVNVVNSDHDQLTIDFSEVEQSDSAALAVMLEWANQARLSQKQVTYENVPSQLMRLIKMAELQNILKFA